MEKADRCQSCDSVLLPEETHADHNACLKALAKRIDDLRHFTEGHALLPKHGGEPPDD